MYEYLLDSTHIIDLTEYLPWKEVYAYRNVYNILDPKDAPGKHHSSVSQLQIYLFYWLYLLYD